MSCGPGRCLEEHFPQDTVEVSYHLQWASPNAQPMGGTREMVGLSHPPNSAFL